MENQLTFQQQNEEKICSYNLCRKRRLPNKVMVDQHFSIHPATKSYICHACQKSLSNKSCLTKHVEMHGEEEIHTCNK